MVHGDRITGSRKIDISLAYIKDLRLDSCDIHNYPHISLIVEFHKSLNMLSTLEGYLANVRIIGNHYAPVAYWEAVKNNDIRGLRDRLCRMQCKTGNDSSFLFTAADVERVAIVRKEYRGLAVHAIVTAGVETNAMRMAKDNGGFFEPGTINMLLLPSKRLAQQAMTGAIITATEAKSAALQDLDIRSSYNPEYQATGTGTDNIIIAEGDGDRLLERSGGHTKLGELIAKAVYQAVKEAIYNQNGLISPRSIFKRLNERKIGFGRDQIFDGVKCGMNKNMLITELEKLLLEPEYASFIASSFSISDNYERKLITDLTPFKKWCILIAQEISGSDTLETAEYFKDSHAPAVVQMALNAILNGICNKK